MLTAISIVLISSAASAGADFTSNDAKQFFDRNQQALTATVRLISSCVGPGVASIYP